MIYMCGVLSEHLSGMIKFPVMPQVMHADLESPAGEVVSQLGRNLITAGNEIK
jgi:hypothetical protein